MESYYDEAKAERAFQFFRGLTHIKGKKWAGKPFQLLEWQEKATRDIFGWMRPDGTRWYRKAYIEVPKKNGKTEWAAGIGLLLTFGDGEPAAEVYVGAGDKDQAAICADVAAAMVKNSIPLSKIAKCIQSRKTITYPRLGSVLKALSAEAYTKHGLNAHGVIFDELHAQKDREFFDTLTIGSGDARSEPLLLIITTAGNQRRGVGWEWHEKARQILNGNREDPYTYVVLYGIEENDDWEDEANWIKANPAIGSILDLERIREHYKDCRGNPIEENKFQQLRLNRWVKQSFRWMPMQYWDKCNRLPFLAGRDCWAGLDLSTTYDLTALSLVFQLPRDEYAVMTYFWIPRRAAEERERNDAIPYSKWARDGFIEITDGETIDYNYIIKFIDDLQSYFNIKEIAFDRWGASKIRTDLEDKGFTMVQFGQGFASMSAPTKELLNLTLNGKMHHGGNPILRWNADNVAIKTDPSGNVKPDKEKSTQKIDGIVSEIMALARAQEAVPEFVSQYETERLTVV